MRTGYNISRRLSKHLFHADFWLKFTIAGILMCFTPLWGQVYVPLDQDHIIESEQKIFGLQSFYSTFLKPYDYAWYESLIQPVDSAKSVKGRSWWIRKLFYESYLSVDSSDYRLEANPLFNFSYGSMSGSSQPFYHNIRGAAIGGNLLGKLYFESSVLECQSRWPLYVSDFVHSSNVAPGMGQARRFGSGGFDYAIAQGSIAFPVNRHCKIYLGTGKFFAGDGYRSLLLSDVSFNYPYLYVRYHYRNWYFSRIFATTMSDTLPLTAYGVREKRLNNFGIISFVPHRAIELSFFEGYVFRYPNRIRHISINPLFFNPLPVVNLLKTDSGFSSVLGINVRINLLPGMILYQQVAVSNPHYRRIDKNNTGYQAGIKWYNAFTLRNLFLQAEWNRVGERAFVSSDSLLNYTHYNQPLGHLLGNNFDEKILHASFTAGRFNLSAHGVWSQYGQKGMGLLPRKSRFVELINYPAPLLGTGPYTEMRYWAVTMGYWVNPRASQKIEVGFVSRQATIATLSLHSQIFYVAFKVNWNNMYVDF